MYDANGKFRRFFSIDPIEGADSLVEKAASQQELPPSVVIKGFCTTESVDADGEIVDPRGIDFGPFMREGTITDGHPATRDNIVGEPISLESRRHPEGGDGFFLTGKLYLRVPRGRAILEQHNGLLKSGARRGLGFSIEGVVIERDPYNRRKIAKSRITSVAIDPYPKNKFSLLEQIAMAMGSRGRDLTGMDPAIFSEALEEAFFKALGRHQTGESALSGHFSQEQLMALTYLVKAPEMTFSTAMAHVRRFKQGGRIHG